jgi:SWI/SNF-related matrix-associated actin-dependent regulator of chromatin subfamily D
VEADRAEVVMGLWEYVKLFGLQEDEEKRMIRCDDALKQVCFSLCLRIAKANEPQIFGVDTIFFPHIPERITPHLHPLAPVKLPYTIRVDEAFVSNPVPTIYEVPVQIEDPIRVKVLQLLQNPEYTAQLRQIAKLDEELALIIQAIQHSKSKHHFMKAFAKEPVGFVNKWVSSQKRDLEVILGEAARGGGEDGMGAEFSKGGKEGVWGSEPVLEAVRYMLAKPEVGKTN